MNKYVFLDIDGVLAVPTIGKSTWQLSDEKQQLLGKIIEETDAGIVLTSSWRMRSVIATRQYLEGMGFKFGIHLVGVTIRAYQYLNKDQKIHLSIPRGVEIKQWIDTNIHSNNGKDWNRKTLGKDYTYIILDDDSDMLLEHKDNFIQTKSLIGLTESQADEAIAILNGAN